MSVWQEDYKWHFDYVRLVADAGFVFGRKQLQNFDKTKLVAINIESIIKDRDIGIVEKYVPIIMQFVLDPEQTELLDASFVKIFQMSQLCIEYLVYCKKHLDNTVYVLKEDYKKLQNENKELTEFAEELKAHIARLTTDLKPSSIFQCNECSKLFSTEEYLNAHIKRRHTNSNQNDPLKNDSSNDKLHTEIKELKGRLNTTEKLLQQYQNEIQTTKENTNNVVINDIEQKFVDLRSEVENELKSLKIHSNFEEKCEKFFGIALENIEQLKMLKNNNEIDQIKTKRETTTQTDVNNDQPNKSDEKIDETDNTQKQIKEIADNLNTKVTSTLEKFENQMQSSMKSLLEKFHKIEEIHKTETSNIPVVKPRTKLTTNPTTPLENIEKSPVKIRQRQRWIKCDHIKENPVIVEVARDDSEDNSENSESEHEEIAERQPSITEETEEKPPSIHEFNEHPVENEDRIDESPKIRVSEPKKSSPIRQVQQQGVELVTKTPAPRKSNKKIYKSIDKKPVLEQEIQHAFQTEIEDLVNRRLQNLGISPEWKGIPLKTYQQASEISEHQTNLRKKSLPNFDKISKQIEMEINKKTEEKHNQQPDKNRKKDGGNHKKFTKSIQRIPTFASQVEIKNRKLYETDSESVDGLLNDTKPIVTRYSAVIDELKNKSKLFDTDQTRGVLKNYPSYATLTKKRVNFDLKHDNNVKEGYKLVIRDGGSTTSVGSSVLDVTPTKKLQSIEIVSDFDLNDL